MYKLGTNTFGLDKYLLEDRIGTYQKLASYGYQFIEPCVFSYKDLVVLKDKITFGGSIWDVDKIQEMILEAREYGLDVATIFVQYLPSTDIDSLIETILSIAEKTNVTNYVSAPRLSNKQEVEEAAKNVNHIAAVLKQHGLKYYYHNHDREFEKITVNEKEMYIFDYFLSLISEDVSLEADIGWMQMKGVNLEKYLLSCKDKIHLLHLNDLSAERQPSERHSGWCSFGSGVIDHKAVTQVIKKLNLENNLIIIDQEWAKDDMIEEMKNNAEFVQKNLNSVKPHLSHCGFNVSNMKKTLKFYTEIMGFERAFSFHMDDNPWIEFIRIAPYQYVELFYEKPNREYNYINGSFKHFCIDVADVRAYAEQIKAKGCELFKEPQLGPDGNWQFWVKDPDGHQIEIIQVDENSPHEQFEKDEKYRVYEFHMSDFVK